MSIHFTRQLDPNHYLSHHQKQVYNFNWSLFLVITNSRFVFCDIVVETGVKKKRLDSALALVYFFN